jgi:hypothetical protein
MEEAKAFADDAMRQVLPVAQEAEVRLGIAWMGAVSPDVRVHTSRGVETARPAGAPAP